MLPALAGSPREALAGHRAAATSMVEGILSGQPVHLLPEGAPPVAVIGSETVSLPASFVPDLERMGRALDRLRAMPPPPDDALTPAILRAQAEAWSAMDAARVLVKGTTYRVTRTAVVGRGGRGEEVVLLPEPVVDAIAAMEASRASFPDAVAQHARTRELWSTADPRGLFENLLRRDAVQHYDDDKRRRHLELVLEALVPNLVETVVVDVAGVLEAALAGSLPEDPVACVSVRDATPLNALVGYEDQRFAAEIAPLVLVVRDQPGNATVTTLVADDGKVRERSARSRLPGRVAGAPEPGP